MNFLKTVLLLGCCCLTYPQLATTQTINNEHYFQITPDPAYARLFQLYGSNYLTYFVSDSLQIGEHWYFPKITRYASGKIDTTYYREDAQHFYHFQAVSKHESVEMPKMPAVGQQWFEADSSWSYTILSMNEKLKTPAAKYTELLLLECEQLTGRDKAKAKRYHLYYARGKGHVATKINGELISYCYKEVSGAKDGDVVGPQKSKKR